MALKVGQEVDVVIDKRLAQHTRDHAIGDVYDALAELITNADDSYGKLFRDKKLPHDGGHILIEHLEQRKGSPSQIVIRDRAQGMDDHDMEENLLHMGRHGSKAGDRGYMGRGAKDCSALGAVTFESIKDARYYRARISHDLKFKWEARRDRATAQIRKRLGIPKHNGTSVTIDLLPGVKLPRVDTLAAELPWHFALRDIMSENASGQVLLRRAGASESHRLVYRRPEGEQVVDEVFTVDSYPGVTAHLKIWRAPQLLEGDRPRFERSGVVVKGKRAIHECSVLSDDLRRDPNARLFFGRLECPYLDDLLSQFENRRKKGEPPTPDNPHLIMDPNRRHGLERRHPFIKALLQVPIDRLRLLLEREQERETSNTREVASRETRTRLSKLAKLATRFLQNQLDDLDEITEDDDLDNDSFAKRGALIYPTYFRVETGKERSLTIYVRRSMASPDAQVMITTDNPDALSVPATPVKLRVHRKKEDRLIGTFKVVGIRPHDDVLISAKGEGVPDVQAVAKVVEGTKEDRVFQAPLEFERAEYRVREGRRRTLKLFAMVPKLITREATIDVSSVEPNKVAVIGRCRLTPVPGTNYAEGSVTVEGRTLNSTVRITAEVNGVVALATVRVAEQLDRGPSIGFEFRNQDFGNFRAIWADREGRPNILLISAKHASLKRYLGEDPFPGQNTPLFRALLAEIIAESVCRKALALESRERPFDFGWADMGKPELIVDDVFAQFQQRQNEFLALAHECMLSTDEIGALPQEADPTAAKANGSRKA
jgi:hypothetical protein